MLAHVFADVGPDGQQHALAFVVAGTVLVGLAEVTDHDRPVDRADDLRQRDLCGRPRQDVAPSHAPLGPDQTRTLEGEKDLLEVRLGEARALGDVTDRRRPASFVLKRQGEQCPARVVAPGRNLHAPMVLVQAMTAPEPSLRPTLPDYRGACVSNVIPAVLHHDGDHPAWLPAAAGAEQVVMLVLDGLGWEQLQARRIVAPNLTALQGGPITTVAPSTTATALTSLTVGASPAEHGMLGYRLRIGHGDVLNVLRWRSAGGDARQSVPPQEFQHLEPFDGTRPPVITRREFEDSGFTGAHLAGTRLRGWRMPSSLVVLAREAIERGESFVYAYYDGIDKVAHEHGFGDLYDAEVQAADRLVGDLLQALPRGTGLVVTSDHGQVDVGSNVVALHDDVMSASTMLSGEGRFRWVHARPGMASRLLEVTRAHHGHHAWVRSRAEAIAEQWFGGDPGAIGEARLGDVVIAAAEPVAFLDPNDMGEVSMRCRHGSLTNDEMVVPLLGLRV